MDFLGLRQLIKWLAYHIPGFIMDILNYEDHVKSRQDGGHKVDVLLALCVIPTAEHAVSRSQHRASGVESCGDASLNHKYGAL